MYTNRVYMNSNMAKLYWRVKKKGKWTWEPATVYDWKTGPYGGFIVMEYGSTLEVKE